MVKTSISVTTGSSSSSNNNKNKNKSKRNRNKPELKTAPAKTMYGKKKDSSSSAPTVAKSSSSSSSLSNTILKKFERLTTLIDDGICSNIEHAAPDDAGGGGGGCSNSNPMNDISAETAATAPIDNTNNSGEEDHDHGSFLASPDAHNGNFASWLASQEFDASAIVWNGDDNNPQDLSGEFAPADVVETLHNNEERDGNEFEAQAQVATGAGLGVGNMGGVGTVIGGGGGNHRHHHPNEVDMDTYVSISDVKGSRWPQIPDAVSKVWNEVVSSTNWQCWEGQAGCSNTKASSNKSMSKSKLARAKSAETQKESLAIRRRAAEAAASNACVGEQPLQQHSHQPQHHRSASDGGANKPPKHINTKNYKPISILKKPSFGGESLVSQKSSVISAASGRVRLSSEDKTAEKLPSIQGQDQGQECQDQGDQGQECQGGDEIDKLVATSIVRQDKQEEEQQHHDTGKLLKPINLERALSKASLATSVATPLAGEYLMMGESSFGTPCRPNNDTTVNTDHGSCAYSLSPGGPSIAALTAAASAAASAAVLECDGDGFPIVAGQLPPDDNDGDDDYDGKDDSDTLLLLGDSDLNTSKGSTGSSTNKWSKVGRRRRRMRLTK